MLTGYKYVLINKKTGERIELGQSPLLTDAQIKEHTLSIDNWHEFWDFRAERI